MTDRDHPGVAHLAVQADRLLEPLARLTERALVERDHPEIVLGNADRPAIADLGPDGQRLLVEGARPGVVAPVFGDDPEVGIEAAHARLVVEPLADGETLLVAGLGRVVVAALGRHGPRQVEDLARPVVRADGLEGGLARRPGRAVASSNRPCLRATSARAAWLHPCALRSPRAVARDSASPATDSATGQSPTSSMDLGRA